MENNQIWNAWQLKEALGIEIAEGIYGKVQFNSSDIEPGDIFIALPGNNADGHQYIGDAFTRGASAAIIDKDFDIKTKTLIKVKNTKEALQQLALYKRKNSKAKFIAITGSVGKTTTKEIIHTGLSHFGKSFKSRGNFNNELGLKINLASMPSDIEYAVIELGMNHGGEISALTKIVKPDIAIITNVEPAHLAHFNSIEDIAKAKFEIFEGLTLNQGIAILNRDNQFYDFFKETLNSKQIDQIISYGENSQANIILKECSYNVNFTKLSYQTSEGELIRSINHLIPKHLAINFSIGLSVAYALNLNLEKILGAVSSVNLSEGRGKIIDYGSFKLISDYYNASPTSMKASLMFMKNLNYKRKTLIIGDMLELGEHSINFHIELLPYILQTDASLVICIGNYSQEILKQLPNNIIKKHFAKVDECIESLPNIINSSDIILIKASKGIGLKKIAEYINTNFKEK